MNAGAKSDKPILFILYNHRDEYWISTISSHFEASFEIRTIQEFDTSDLRQGKINEDIQRARAAVILLSEEYLFSAEQMRDKTSYFLELAQNGSLVLFGLLVKPCEWSAFPGLRKEYVYPANGISLIEYRGDEQNAELVKFSEVMMQAIRQTPQKDITSSSPPIRSESMRAAHVADQPAETDWLGFQPYVEAVAHFLTQPETVPPLTLSIEGEWGSGKSSFMRQLENRLKENGAKTIRFNAWRHDKEDALWAAFAIEFLRQICGSPKTWRHWRGRYKLFMLRFNWDEGFWDVLRWGSLWILMLCFTGLALISLWYGSESAAGYIIKEISVLLNDEQSVSGWKTSLEWIFYGGTTSTSLALLITLGLKLKTVFGNPLDINLRKHLQSPDYSNRVAFVEQFHKDFRKIVDAYAQNEKVYVFIDDVDRCEVPKAADLMQALNLLISDDPNLVFIIGMDREKVAAGIAVKHEKLMPYLAPASSSGTGGAFDRSRGLEYGYAFIEKFIQVPFLIPEATATNLDAFLENIASTSNATADSAKPFFAKFREWRFNRKKSSTETTFPPPEPPIKPAEERKAPYSKILQLTFTKGESKEVQSVVKLVAPILDNNPRRIKQFINVFRLQAYIGSSLGYFGNYEEKDKLIQLEQLGKFVAICLKWPLLRADLEKHQDLLRNMQYLAMDTPSLQKNKKVDLARKECLDRAMDWLTRPGLRELLRAGCIDDTGKALPEEKWASSLARLDVRKLLNVSAKVEPPDNEEFLKKAAKKKAVKKKPLASIPAKKKAVMKKRVVRK